MSTEAEKEDVSQVDQFLPEDGIDVSKVTNLDELGKIAGVNSAQTRALQRRLVSYREDIGKANLIEPIEEAIAIRQQRGIKLVRQRTALQEKENTKRRTVLEEALKPTIGVLNNDKRLVMNQMIEICDRIKAMRGKYLEHKTEHRRMEARLKQWESTLTAMILGLEKLAQIPTDLE